MTSGLPVDRIASPGMVGGKTTQTVHIQIAGDVDAHCARARAAGAQIFAEPENQFYGDRLCLYFAERLKVQFPGLSRADGPSPITRSRTPFTTATW